MNDYIIFTDSACDINPSLLKEWGVEYINMTFLFEGEDGEYTNSDIAIKDFYNKMREGGVAKTAAVNPEKFTAAFEEAFRQGKDILYLGFSSGLSITYNSARVAAEELSSRYPDRKIITIDTLAASAGEGLIVCLTARKKQSGADIEEAAAYAEESIPKLCHWFTVDDLEYLKRGGRVSSAAAFAGNMLRIKPVLHVDDDGHLINVLKAHGRKTSIAKMVEKYGELAETPNRGTVFISHGDCMEDAEYLKTQLNAKYGVDVELIADIGPVIGAHSGPGTLAVFFIGKQR